MNKFSDVTTQDPRIRLLMIIGFRIADIKYSWKHFKYTLPEGHLPWGPAPFPLMGNKWLS